MLESNLASGCTVDVAGIQGWLAGSKQCTVQEFSAAEQGFQTLFSHTTVTTQNMQAYR
jgi:hypothetical protein